MLIKAKIINYSPEHFAKIIFTQPYGLLEKSQFLFDSKDEFSYEVRDSFLTLFNFKDLTMKELLIEIHTRISPPVDSEKKAQFYEDICDEYYSQNQHRKISSQNILFMLSSTFFVITDLKHKQRKAGIS